MTVTAGNDERRPAGTRALPTLSPRPLVLGIETSCDDTACAVLDGKGCVLSSVVSTQLAAHVDYGGVVPEIASREHLRNLPMVQQRALNEAGVELSDLDLIAATRGPGLVGSLLVGLSAGKAMAYGLGKPFFGVHHLEGHLFSPFLASPGKPGDGGGWRPSRPARPVPERFVGLVVSGGHTALYSVEHDRPETVSETRDDAMGECFDKVGKRLGLPFPAGPIVDSLAELGRVDAHGRTAGSEIKEGGLHFRTPRCGDTLDFSYSGLKTQALVEIERLEKRGLCLKEGALCRLARQQPQERTPEAVTAVRVWLDLLAAFRHAAVRQIVDRVGRYHRLRAFQDLAVSGGVAANQQLRRELARWGQGRGTRVHLVDLRYCGDNAAMIAYAALRRMARGDEGDPLAVDAQSRLAVGLEPPPPSSS